MLPGFQTQGIRGRAIADGAPRLRVLRQRIAIKTRVHTLGGLSAHAGQSQWLDRVKHFDHRAELYWVHGEMEKMKVLQQALHDRLQWTANIPEPGEQIAC